MLRASVLLAAVCVPLLHGCGTEFVFDEDERVVEAKKRISSPLPFKAGLSPLRITFDPGRENLAAKRRFSSTPNLAALHADLLDCIRRTGILKSAEAISQDSADKPDGPLEAAWEKELDFLIEIDFGRWDATYKGVNFWFIPNLILWFQFWIPAEFVPDEEYAVEIDAAVTVRSVHTGKVVLRKNVSVSYQESFSNLGRGWQFLGMFRSPDSLDAGNWEKISESLAAGAIHELKVAVASMLAADLPRECASPSFGDSMRKRMALVMGVSNYLHHRFPKAIFARDDAESFGRFLTAETGAGIPGRNVKLLLGESATHSNFRNVFNDFILRRAGPDDEVYVFFAGLGALSAEPSGTGDAQTGRRRLLPSDAVPDAIADTSISIDDLLRSLRSCKARSVLFIDASFLPAGGNRSFQIAGSGESGQTPGPEEAEGRITILMAADAGQDCGFMEARRHGLFSYFLVQGLEGKADANDDGVITLAETFKYAKKNTEIQAFVEDGRQQIPVLSGMPAADVVIARKGRK